MGILSSEYGTRYTQNGCDVVKDDLYFLEYGNRNARQQRHSTLSSKEFKYLYAPNIARSPNHNTPSPLTPQSVHTAHTTIHSPHSVHSSRTPHTPHSMNHAFPRFIPYSNHQTQSTVSTGVSTTSSSLKEKEEIKEVELKKQEKEEIKEEKKEEQHKVELSHSVLSELELSPDTLRDSSTDFRPVFSCIRPIVCHKSNTPFYAQCSTAKLGYCTWCRQQRRGNQRQGSICLNCGERLTAKYHRWYPHLVRLEPLEKTRSKAMYTMYKPVFERFGITWHNEKQFEFVIDHYMLIKIYLSTQNFDVAPLHLERTYMIGVFAGREFNTGALARKLLREGSKLAMFRADFPDYYDFLRDERAAVAEQIYS